MKKHCCIVIPAYKPGEELVRYVAQLLSEDVGPVVIVDDGSGASYGAVFGQAGGLKGCTVLRHRENRGKGAALKTAIAWYLRQQNRGGRGTALRETGPSLRAAAGELWTDMGDCLGIVTVDCDGQHSAKDVMKVVRTMRECGERQRRYLILGCRTFGEDTPIKSAVGNRLMALGMKFLYGMDLEDTQTGLRGISESLLEEFEKLSGQRYEYEMNMLIYAAKMGLPVIAVPIQTIYFNGNRDSHFRPAADSLRIFGQMCLGALRRRSGVYGPFVRLLRSLLRKTAMKDWCVSTPWDGSANGMEPAVYVVHHQDLRGPVRTVLLLPREVRVWVFHVFCSRKSCFRQYWEYTFTRRMHWPSAAAFAAAAGLSLGVPALLRGLGAIPVYRGGRDIRKTMKTSEQALLRGESLLICPDRDYAGRSGEMGEMYKGFLRLERSYFKQTGKHLAFVPIKGDEEEKRLWVGKAVFFSGQKPFHMEAEFVAQRLRAAMNRLPDGDVKKIVRYS